MPYNLRKRKVPPEPVEQKAVEVDKKPKARAKKQKTVVESQEETEVPETNNVVEKKPAAIKRQKSSARVKPLAESKPAEEPEQAVESKPKVALKSIDEPVVEEKPKKLDAGNQLVFGSDTCGELGFKKIGCTKKTPTPVPLPERIKQVVCGPMHTISLTDSGLIYSYGCNDEGALGRVTDGDETLESTPTIVELKDKVTKVTAGDSHTAALTEKNDIFIWGNFRDDHGSIGLLPECNGQAVHKPTQVMPDKKFKDIASGSNHMLLLDVDGVVYSFGVGAQGQLGRLKQEEVGSSDASVAITAENRDLFLSPTVVSLKNVDPQRPFVCDAIYAGNFSSFATNTDKKKNRLAGWGLNNYHQLGYKGQKDQLVQFFPRRSTFTCSTSMVSVACGQHHTIFLTKTGRVYAAGRHQYGMLGIGAGMQNNNVAVCPARQVEGFENPIKTICAGINTSFAVDQKGQLYAWGMSGPSLGIESVDSEDLMEPTLMKALASKEVQSVSSGSSFTAIIVN